ncbi:MAG: type IV pilus twitching motility protein PilT [Gemmatimonadales bacterium]
MARLDKFIQVLAEQKAEALELAHGKPASLLTAAGVRPLTKDPVTLPQIVTLLREIATGAPAADLAAGQSATFSYASPSGDVQVVFSTQDGGSARLRLGSASAAPAARASGETPVAAPPPGHKPPPTRASQMYRAVSDELEGPRKRMEALFRQLVETSSSDLHLRTGEPPLLRTHGEMHRTDGATLGEAELEVMLQSVMTPKAAGEHKERNDADWAYEIDGLARFRCNAGRDRLGPFGVFRVIPTTVLTADQLGLSQEVQNLAYLTKGLVVVTGPTGSGKSTTLASIVDLVNRSRSDHIITIEDPIEFVHKSQKCIVTQREVGLHTMGFKNALRAALREDPDIVLVGEMRDLETVAIAIETAETGHLVFGTLHTTTAASTIDRIIDQFSADRQAQIRVMLSESLKGVVAQTLCKKIGGGRVAAREILITNSAVSNLIREGKTFQIPSIMQTSKKLGMVTMNDALMELVDKKQVTSQEAYMKSVDKSSFAAGLKAKKHDVSFLDSVKE